MLAPALISLLMALAVTQASAQESPIISCGFPDIDQIRTEVQHSPTTAANFTARRSALARWWRLLWHQGQDLSAFSDTATTLMQVQAPARLLHPAIDRGFSIMEDIQADPQFIPEIPATLDQGSDVESNSVTDWPMYLSTDGTNQGYSPDRGPETGTIAWRFPKSYDWTARPVIHGESIYVSAPGPDVVGYMVDATTGQTQWRAHQDGFDLYSNWGSFVDPIVLDTIAIFRTGGYGLTSVVTDRITGEPTDLPEKNDSPQSYISYFFNKNGNQGASICVADANSGHPVMWHNTPHACTGDPVAAGDYVYVADVSGRVSCLDPAAHTVKWSKQLPQSLAGGIATANGRLFICGHNETVYCLDIADGSTVWTQRCAPPHAHSSQFFSTATIADGSVYLGAADGVVYCLNESTGAVQWTHATDSWIRARPLVIDGTIYVATLDSDVIALQTRGDQVTEQWRVRIGVHGYTADLVGNRDRILLSGRDLLLYSVSPTDGSLQWQHGIIDGAWVDGQHIPSGNMIGFMGSPSIVDGTLYIGGPDGFVNAVDSETGVEQWRFELGGSLSGQPTVAEDMVFIARQSGGPARFCALNRFTGDPIWESNAFGNIWVAAVYHNGRIFFGNREGQVFAVTAATGKVEWTYDVTTDVPAADMPQQGSDLHGREPGIYSNPAIDDDTLYLGSWIGYYFALDQQSGALRWLTRTRDDKGGLPDSAAPMLHKNHLYVQKKGRYVSALNKHDGAIAWEWLAPPGYLQNGTVAAHGDQIYLSMVRGVTTLPYHATILAFQDVESGSEPLWEFEGGGGLTAPVLTDDKLIVGSSAGVFMTCLDPLSGSVKWRTYTGGEMLENVPALYGNKVFAITKNGWLIAIE